MDNATNSDDGRYGGSWAFTQEAERLARPTILVVEDDRDIRDMLVTLLELAQFVPVACDTAEQGLNALRENTFDLILTDYALPRHSGVWLLERAAAEGLIDGVPVLIVTAHPHVSGANGYEIVQKPFDLDDLVNRVRYRLESSRPPRRRLTNNADAPRDGGSHDGDQRDCPDPVELILYVSAQSPRSVAAVKNIQKILSRFSASRVKLTICDLSENPAGGIEDGIAFTPTLVRRAPGPRTFILGHITSPEVLLELLGDCDLDES